VRSLVETRRRFAGGGPSLSERSEESTADGAGEPFKLLSCDGGGVGRLGSMCSRMREEDDIAADKAARSSGGGEGVRPPSDDRGDEERENGGREDSGLLPPEVSSMLEVEEGAMRWYLAGRCRENNARDYVGSARQ
jgi:hypothetical protein